MAIEKNLESPEYWDAFGRQLLEPGQRPTPEEAAECFAKLRAKVAAAEAAAAQAKHEEKCAKQQFEIFSMEASNLLGKLAQKYKPVF